MMIFRILGVVCYVIGIADLVSANIFGVDFTGVTWSPIVAALIGAGFFWLARRFAPAAPAEQTAEVEIMEDSADNTDSSVEGDSFVPPSAEDDTRK